ncbi:MAG: nucleoside triphosphate pyrophosphohydrolase [Candidatus Melainabacteria bacterium]|nr:nucleoside triphosphate pyrophosphohydrolase [Candidatus Melainabacteria bacterium]
MSLDLESSNLEGSHLEQFITTVAKLRSPEGCPWDREQTHKSLARYLLEEAYEVMEAIHEGDPEKIKEELGDLLLQIVLNSQVAKDDGNFTIEDVAASINAKMIRRHPHVFADSKVDTAEGVVSQWQELKAKEKQEKLDSSSAEPEKKESALAGVPRTMPALLQALKISEKAVNQGFEWEKEADVWAKLHSEISELQEAISHPDLISPQKGQQKNADNAKQAVALEFGDALFCMVNLARWHALDPEECLLMTINKFKSRFEWMEENSKRPLKEHSPEQLNDLWEGAKSALSENL